MTKDEALRLALEALESTGENNGYHGVTQYFDETMVDQAITAIKAALEAKDEPVAYINVEQRKLEWAKYMSWDTPTVVNLPKIPLYTTPPQRTWVGLTDEEIRKWWASENGLEDCDMCKIDDFILVARAIEAKLKEKNT
jgi:hypothetical protein